MFDSDLNFLSTIEEVRVKTTVRHFNVPARYVAFRTRPGMSLNERLESALKADREGTAVDLFHTYIYNQRGKRVELDFVHLDVSRDLDLIMDVEMMFVASHAGLKEAFEEYEFDLETMDGVRMWQETMRNMIDLTKLSVDPLKIWRGRFDILGRFKENQKGFNRKYARLKSAFRDFECVTPLKPSSDFQPTRITLTCPFADITFSSIEMAFDAMHCTSRVPFLSCGRVPWRKTFSNTVQIHKAFLDDAQLQADSVVYAVMDEWTDDKPSQFTICRVDKEKRIYFDLRPQTMDKSRHAKSLLSLNSSRVPFVTIFHQPSLQHLPKICSLDSLLDRWEHVFDDAKFDRTKIIQQGVTGTLAFSKVPFNPIALTHLFSVHAHLTSLVRVLEPSPWRPMHLLKSVDVQDEETGMILKLSAHSDGSIVVKVIKCLNVESFENVATRWLFISMAVYIRDYNAMLENYSVPGLAWLEKNDIVQHEIVPALGSQWTLRQLAPDIFLPKYTRHCYAVPTIVSDVEAADLRREGVQVMTFPKEGPNQLHYTCHFNKDSAIEKKRKFIFPGLTANPLSNNKVWPYTPCCFTNNQINKAPHKKKSYYDHYYNPSHCSPAPKVKILPARKMTLSPKALEGQDKGTLPPLVNTLFNIVNSDFQYYRQGYAFSPDAVFDCLNVLNMPRPSRASLVQESAIPCWPYCHGERLSEVQRAMLNGPFLPSRYTPALERAYNISILVFGFAPELLGRTLGGGELLVPLDKEIIFEPTRERVIFLFQHWGIEDQDLPHPHVELIFRGNQCIFHRDDPLVQRILEVRHDMTKFVSLPPPQPLKLTFTIESQCLDSDQHCRALFTTAGLLKLFQPRPPLHGVPLCHDIRGTLKKKWKENLKEVSEPHPMGRLVTTVHWSSNKFTRVLQEKKRVNSELSSGIASTPEAEYVLQWRQQHKQKDFIWDVPQTLLEAHPRHCSILNASLPGSTSIVVQVISSLLTPPYVFAHPLFNEGKHYRVDSHTADKNACFLWTGDEFHTQPCLHSSHARIILNWRDEITATLTFLTNNVS